MWSVGCAETTKTKKGKRKKERKNPLEGRKEERRKEERRIRDSIRREKTKGEAFLLELGFFFISIVGFNFVVRRYVLFLCVSPLRQQVCGIFFRSRRCRFFG